MKRLTVLLSVVLVVAVPLVLAACGEEDEGAGGASPSPTAGADAATVPGTLSTFGLNALATAIEAAGIDQLQDEGPYTVFAPTDPAFENIPTELFEGLMQDPGQLGDVLGYHVVEGEIRSTDLENGMTLTTLQGGELAIRVEDGMAYVNDVLITTPDVEAENGVIHIIDEVLLPPGVATPSP